MTTLGQSQSFSIHLAKVQAYSQGQQDEIGKKRKRSQATFIKKYGRQAGVVVWRSYIQGYEDRRKFREASDQLVWKKK